VIGSTVFYRPGRHSAEPTAEQEVDPMNRGIARERRRCVGERLHSRLLEEGDDLRTVDRGVEIAADEGGVGASGDRLGESPQLGRPPILTQPEVNAPHGHVAQCDADGATRLTAAAGKRKPERHPWSPARQDRVPECGRTKAESPIEARVHTEAPGERSRLIGKARARKVAVNLLEEDHVAGALRQSVRDPEEGRIACRIAARMDVVGANPHMFHVKRDRR
jgi:hypothetical protein